MSEESHRDAMNSAIRAQRERGNVPRSMLPPENEPAPVPVAQEPEPMPAPEPAPPIEPEPTPEREDTPEPAAKKSVFARLLGR